MENSGKKKSDAQIFIALNMGTEKYWLYPNWVMYPPNIDWKTRNIRFEETKFIEIIPEFIWPSGVGAYDGAKFIAVVMHNDELISDVAEFSFSWTDDPPPTPPSTPIVPDGFVYIPPGNYVRGSPDDEPCSGSATDNEQQHQVTFTRGLFVLKTVVTRQMWNDLSIAEPSLPIDPSFEDYSPTLAHPVQRVTWYESVLFANLLSLNQGYSRCYFNNAELTVPIDSSNYKLLPFFCDFCADGFRLPTDAEWEYVARAGTKDPFSEPEPNFTSTACFDCPPDPPLTGLDKVAWWCGNSDFTTYPVGIKKPNPWGLFDVHGNTSEWCWDWWSDHKVFSVIDPERSKGHGYNRT
ncbi:formylglycine-generating enzyme family protein [bacterium]|nr:formylglycine-generating enzyme family protein [bacterium]